MPFVCRRYNHSNLKVIIFLINISTNWSGKSLTKLELLPVLAAVETTFNTSRMQSGADAGYIQKYSLMPDCDTIE
jgi:hypothetical protein